jgi:hypothetical protein
VLAESLRKYAGRDDVVVLALPRGGVPVAYEVAKALGAPLEAGHSGPTRSWRWGAIASGGLFVLDERLVRSLGIDETQLERAIDMELRELERREAAYGAASSLSSVARRSFWSTTAWPPGRRDGQRPGHVAVTAWRRGRPLAGRPELGERTGVLRFVQAHLAAARDLESGRQAPAFIRHRRDELHALALELRDRSLDVVAHQEELVMSDVLPPSRAWMDAELGGRQREDQPALAVVHGRQVEHVAEERPSGFCILGVDESVDTADHSAGTVSGSTR